MTMKPPIANVGTLGLWAFALTTAMLSVKELRVGASDDGAVGVTIGFAFGFGGLVQLLAGILSALRGQSFSAVAFASYGGFWLSYGTYEVLAYEASSLAIKSPKKPCCSCGDFSLLCSSVRR